jgi:acyl carrier protein
MSRIEIEGGVRTAIGAVSTHDVSTVETDDDLVEALGIDSLQALQILAAVEKRFDVRIPDEELSGLRSICALVQAVERAARHDDAGADMSRAVDDRPTDDERPERTTDDERLDERRTTNDQ